MRSKEQKQKVFNEIIELIEEGNSLRKAVKQIGISSRTFYEIIDNEENEEERKKMQKRYACACEERAEAMFDEIFEIADDSSNDTEIIYDKDGNAKEVENREWVNRSRLRVDSRKWALSKMQPKKYGDKLDLGFGEETDKVNIVLNLSSLDDSNKSSNKKAKR